MAFFEEVVIKDAIEIRTTAEKVFNFLTSIVDDDCYRAWHKDDHVSLRWLKGDPWTEGSVVCAEEYIHGKLHKLRFEITKIIPGRRIEYTPTSRLIRKFFPKNEFIIEQKGESCLFTASGTYRVGKLGKIFFKKAVEKNLAGIKKHMREEGENLKSLLES
jgi:hypothetical protein